MQTVTITYRGVPLTLTGEYHAGTYQDLPPCFDLEHVFVGEQDLIELLDGMQYQWGPLTFDVLDELRTLACDELDRQMVDNDINGIALPIGKEIHHAHP